MSPEVIKVVRDSQHWDRTAQLVRITKPFVDAIGNIESRDASLADCMLEILRCAVNLQAQEPEIGDDVEFLAFAKATFNIEFKELHTDIHFLALYLHPLCRTLAISPEAGRSRGGRTFADVCRVALELVQSLGWSQDTAKKVLSDLQAYQACKGPFAGGLKDGAAWWKSVSVPVEDHPLKGLAILLFKIVPHSAEVERLFSGFGIVQTPRRCRLTVPNFERAGKLRSHYVGLVQEMARKAGKDPRRRHGHSKVPEQPGLNLETAARLEEAAVAQEIEEDRDAEGEDDEEVVMMEEIEAAFEALEIGAMASPVTDVLSAGGGGGSVDALAMYSVSRLGAIDAAVAPRAVEDDLRALRNGQAAWTAGDLLTSMGLI